MITADQRAEFDRTGLLRLPGAVDADRVAGMVDRIWEQFEAERAVRDRPETWPGGRVRGMRKVACNPEFRAIGSPTILAALDDLLGADRWATPNRWGRLLITFPTEGSWDVPRDVWHNDFMPLREQPDPRAVQLFVILSDLEPGGGGTLVLTGSHRLIGSCLDAFDDGPHPKRLRRILGADPWLRELWRPRIDEPADRRIQRFMIDGGDVNGVRLRVVELTGRAGDAYLMHCDTFHCAAPNHQDQPRIMVTGMIARQDQISCRPGARGSNTGPAAAVRQGDHPKRRG